MLSALCINWKATAAAALLLGMSVSAAAAQSTPAPAPPTVQIAAVKLAPVTRDAVFVGTVAAVQQVAIIARVQGFLSSVNFREGSFVKTGETLFEIEKDTYQAALDGANATLAAANAAKSGAVVTLKLAEINLTRQKTLLASRAVAQEIVDQSDNTDVTWLAETMVAAQQGEINLIDSMLKDLRATP